MAIKGGAIVTAGNGNTVIDRIQTAGPGQVNIPTEKINELGNYKSVATVRDTPDLTFSYESFDVSTETEKMITGQDGTNGYDLSRAKPVDIVSQFKAGRDAADPFQVLASVAVPFLYLEQMSYRFGLRDNASQSGQFRGDSIFYNPGPAYVQSEVGTGTAGQTIATDFPAFQSAEGDQRRVLSVSVGNKRLALGSDYTESSTASGDAEIATITLKDAVAPTSTVRLVYSSPTTLSYPASVHEGVSVKPAAVKGRDIDIYLGGYDINATPAEQLNRVAGVQSINVDWRVTLEKDEEFGNYYATAQDFDVPAVTGSVDFQPRDVADLLVRLRQMANVSNPNHVIGSATSAPLELDVVIRNPEDGQPVKRFHVPDARFTVPGFTGRVNQKTSLAINWESDEGELLIFDS